jgi:predicted phage terminase large subunit-like protein
MEAQAVKARRAEDERRQAELRASAEQIRARCSTLAGFVQEAWHVLEPRTPLVWGWHLDAVCSHLEAVVRGDINRLLINIPPGMSKSMLTSVMLQAYEWGPCGNPSKRYLTTSFNDGPVKRDTRKTRDLIMSPWFQALWPNVVLTRAGETSFANTATGTREGVAFGSLTSQRGDCLTGATLVETDEGAKTIQEIVTDAQSCNVLSYDSHSKSLVYRPVKAVARCRSNNIYRVHAASGRVVECTGDHRFYTDRGFVAARLLSKGDRLLLAVQSGHGEDGSGLEEKQGEELQRPVLQSCLRDDLYERAAGQNWEELHGLRNESGPGKGGLFGGMPGAGQETCGAENQKRSSDCQVRDLSAGISDEGADQGGAVLFPHMQGQGPCQTDAGRGKPWLAWRRCANQIYLILSKGFSRGPASSSGSGRKEMRRLQIRRGPDCSPHRHGRQQQQTVELGRALPDLPHRFPPSREAETAADTVALVERVRGEQAVFDLQIDETQCFFANGVLVHNCLLIDDPHSTKTAESEAERNNTTRQFREGAQNRLNDQEKSAIIVIMQRLHEKDVSGQIVALGMGYTHLMLPMEFEPARACRTSIGWSDPRTDDGELLDPRRFPRETVDKLKRDLGSYAYAGQYLQRPTPREGGLFKRHWFAGKVIKTAPRGTIWVRGWDLAATKLDATDTRGARTAGVKLGLTPTGEFIVGDMKAAGEDAENVERLIRTVAEIDGVGVSIDLPQDPGQAGKVQKRALVKALAGYNVRVTPETGDKVTRATPLSSQAEGGNLFLLEGPWNEEYLEEICLFPGGARKDLVDATSRAFGALQLLKPAVNNLAGAEEITDDGPDLDHGGPKIDNADLY